MTPFEMLTEFMDKFKVEYPCSLTNLDARDLAWNLIDEEQNEVWEELYDRDSFDKFHRDVDKIKLTKELADLMYVTIYMAHKFNLPLEAVFEAVHKSNMSKLDENGEPLLREDGKVLKGPNYQPPNLEVLFQ